MKLCNHKPTFSKTENWHSKCEICGKFQTSTYFRLIKSNLLETGELDLKVNLNRGFDIVDNNGQSKNFATLNDVKEWCEEIYNP